MSHKYKPKFPIIQLTEERIKRAKQLDKLHDLIRDFVEKNNLADDEVISLLSSLMFRVGFWHDENAGMGYRNLILTN